MRIGNCTTEEMLRSMQRHSREIEEFADRSEEAILVLGL
jgi:hypothetical protein